MKKLLRSKTFHKALGITVSVALIAWMIVTFNWHEVFDAMRSMKIWPVFPTLALVGLHWYLRSLRWRYLLPPAAESPSLRVLFDSFMAGNFATFTLPLRAGEFVRAFLLSRQSKYTFPTAFASIVIERFFDLVTVLFSFAVVLFYVPNMPELVSQGARALGILAIIILVVMLTGVYAPEFLTKMAKFFTAKFPGNLRNIALKFLDDLLHGLTILKHPRNMAMVTFLSILVWLSCYAFYWGFLYFFDLPNTFLVGVAVSVIIALMVAAPSAPGFVGVYEYACIVGLGLFNVPKELALAYALVSHFFQYILIVVYGAYLLTRYNLKLKDLEGSAVTS